MAKYSIEKSYRVYNDSTGEYVRIGPDADGLDLVDIWSCDKDDNIESSGNARISMPLEQAKLVADALNKYLAELETTNE